MIVTAADEIRCRLFDHKQFTGGEIRYTVAELEEKRNWKEFDSLINASNQLDLMKERSAKILEQFKEGQFTDCDFSVNSALLRGDQVINLEKDSKDQRALMEINSVSRFHELEEEFNQKMSIEMSRIDQEIQMKEEKLIEELRRKEAELMSQIPN